MNVEVHNILCCIVNDARHINCGLLDFCKLSIDYQRTDIFLALTDKCKSKYIFYIYVINFIPPYTMVFYIILHHTFLLHIHCICDQYFIKVRESNHVSSYPEILFTENKEKTL